MAPLLAGACIGAADGHVAGLGDVLSYRSVLWVREKAIARRLWRLLRWTRLPRAGNRSGRSKAGPCEDPAFEPRPVLLPRLRSNGALEHGELPIEPVGAAGWFGGRIILSPV